MVESNTCKSHVLWELSISVSSLKVYGCITQASTFQACRLACYCSSVFPTDFQPLMIIFFQLSKMHPVALSLSCAHVMYSLLCTHVFLAGFPRDNQLYLGNRENILTSGSFEGKQCEHLQVTLTGCIRQVWWKEEMSSLFVFGNFIDLPMESQFGEIE